MVTNSVYENDANRLSKVMNFIRDQKFRAIDDSFIPEELKKSYITMLEFAEIGVIAVLNREMKDDNKFCGYDIKDVVHMIANMKK